MRLLDKLLGKLSPSSTRTYYADVPTMFGQARVYDTVTPEGDILRVLDIAGTWQSACYVDENKPDLAFEYHRVFDHALRAPITLSHALMLGGGAFSYPKHVVTQTAAMVSVVEIDPKVIDLASRWFFLDRLTTEQRQRLQIHPTDALVFLAKAAENHEQYDLVVNDLFAAEKPTAELMSPEGLELVRTIMSPQGIYVSNVISALEGRKARPLHEVERALGSVFTQVETFALGADDPREPDNNVVFTTNGSYSLADVVFGSSS